MDDHLMTEEMKQDFLDAYSAADDNHNGEITPDRYIALMVALGVPGGISTAQALLQKFSGDQGVVTRSEYLQSVKHANVNNIHLRRYKKMFDEFDLTETDWATREAIEDGLRKMGIEIEDEIKDKLDSMYVENGKISFAEFLRVQLKMPQTRTDVK